MNMQIAICSCSNMLETISMRISLKPAKVADFWLVQCWTHFKSQLTWFKLQVGADSSCLHPVLWLKEMSCDHLWVSISVQAVGQRYCVYFQSHTFRIKVILQSVTCPHTITLGECTLKPCIRTDLLIRNMRAPY